MTRILPSDAYFMSGFEGQYVFIIPSLDLVITRIGFTNSEKSGPWKGKLIGWDHNELFGRVVGCVRNNNEGKAWSDKTI